VANSTFVPYFFSLKTPLKGLQSIFRFCISAKFHTIFFIVLGWALCFAPFNHPFFGMNAFKKKKSIKYISPFKFDFFYN
jgi:hypothetical protein